MHATPPAHIILIDLINLVISAEECKLWSFSLFNFLQSPTISSILVPNILFSADMEMLEEVKGIYMELYNEELHNFYYLADTIAIRRNE
jgi:hypothetical protein